VIARSLLGDTAPPALMGRRENSSVETLIFSGSRRKYENRTKHSCGMWVWEHVAPQAHGTGTRWVRRTGASGRRGTGPSSSWESLPMRGAQRSARRRGAEGVPCPKAHRTCASTSNSGHPLSSSTFPLIPCWPPALTGSAARRWPERSSMRFRQTTLRRERRRARRRAAPGCASWAARGRQRQGG
jgi:hypothetical protein